MVSERLTGFHTEVDHQDHLKTLIVAVLQDYDNIFFATLFGSASKGRMTAQSDVDVAVAAPQKLSVDARLELASALSCAIGKEVDLVDLQAVSGLILEQALCSGEIIKNINHDLYASLLKRFWYNQADMMPYYRRILEHRSRAWLQP